MGRADRKKALPLVLQTLGNLIGTGTLHDTKAPLDLNIAPIRDDAIQFASAFASPLRSSLERASIQRKKSVLPLFCPDGKSIIVQAQSVTADNDSGLLSLIDNQTIQDIRHKILRKCKFDYQCKSGRQLSDAFK